MSKLMELIVDPNGSLSHTKIWSNIGMFLICIAFIHEVYSKGLTPELLVAFGGVIVFGRATSKYLDTKGNATEVSV